MGFSRYIAAAQRFITTARCDLGNIGNSAAGCCTFSAGKVQHAVAAARRGTRIGEAHGLPARGFR